MLADVDGGGNTVESRHDDVYEHDVEVVSPNIANSVVGIGTVSLC